MNSQEYWAKREAEQLRHNITEEAEYNKRLKQIYSDMLGACQKEIDAFYGKYASKEGITLAEAKKKVSKLDIAAYERKAKKYVADKDFSAKANEEMRLYNTAMKINRLEMLKANIGTELIAGHDELSKFMDGILKGRTVDELSRQAGILGKTVKNNAAKANAIVNSSFHSGTFSDRIWQYQDLLRADLDRVLTDGLIRGKNPRALAKDMQKLFYGGDPKKDGGYRYCMERLMRTELARVQTEAQKQSFERNGYKEYTFIVNGGCCDICQGLSGKHFPVAKMMPGENAPPMHPHCRCSTAAHSDRKDYEEWLDFLDKGGTTEEYEKQKAAKVNTSLTNKASESDKIKAETFTPAKTIQEAEEFIKQYVDAKQLGALGVSYSGLSIDTANEVNKTLAELFTTFEFDKLGGVNVPKGNTKLGKLLGGATAGYAPLRNSLILNKNALKNLADVAKEHAKVCDMIKEYRADSSSVVFKSSRAERVFKNSIKSGRGTVPDNVASVIHHEMGHALERKVRKATNYETVKVNMTKYAESISGYATESEGEYIAESFASYMKGEGIIDPVLKEVFEGLKR